SSFRDPDSKITGYDWDFDSNGTVDRTTAGPTTSFAYGAAGRFTTTVAAKDFRGGAGRASAAVARPPPRGRGAGDARTPPPAPAPAAPRGDPAAVRHARTGAVPRRLHRHVLGADDARPDPRLGQGARPEAPDDPDAHAPAHARAGAADHGDAPGERPPRRR